MKFISRIQSWLTINKISGVICHMNVISVNVGALISGDAEGAFATLGPLFVVSQQARI